MFEANWEALALDRDLGKTALRLMMLCAAHVRDRDNTIALSQKEMARRLGVTPQAVNGSMRVLVEKGLIFRDGHHYRMNSRLVAKQEDVYDVVQLRAEEAKLLRSLERRQAQRQEHRSL